MKCLALTLWAESSHRGHVPIKEDRGIKAGRTFSRQRCIEYWSCLRLFMLEKLNSTRTFLPKTVCLNIQLSLI